MQMSGPKRSPEARDGPVEQHLRETDGLPGRRAALPAGTLPSPPPDPQADENRDPPPVTESGAGRYRRTVDLAHNTVTPSGNRQRPRLPAIQPAAIHEGLVNTDEQQQRNGHYGS